MTENIPPVPRTSPPLETHRTADGADVGRPLIPQGDQDRLAQRMRQAVSDFVESPRRAVQDADSAFEEIVTGLADALAERRHILRASWQDHDTEARTEELRIALQHYRDVTERLLHI